MKWNGRTRCALVCLCFTVLFSAFSFRLVYLQMIKHDEYAGLAAEKHVYKQAIYAERGAILDANNEVLAHNTPVETVVADATHLNNLDAIVDLVGDALKIPAAELTEKLRGDRRYIVIKREVRRRWRMRSEENSVPRICAAFISSAIPPAFIRTARCFVTSSGSRTSIIAAFRAWKLPWKNICTGRTATVTSNTIAPARKSCFTAGRNAPRATVIRCI